MDCWKENTRFYTYTEWKRGKNNQEIFAALTEVWQDKAPAYSTVARWTADFKSGKRESFEDMVKCGRPVSASGDDPTASVREAIESDPRLSTRAIAELTGIPLRTVWRILSSNLLMRRIASYWVPQVLTEDQRMKRVQSSQAIRIRLLEMGERRYDEYIVEDETWVNFDVEYTSSTASQWVKKGEPRPVAVSSKLTPRKCLVMVAFTASKRINVKSLPYGETINGEVYQEFVQETGKRWWSLTRNPVGLRGKVWQHDNARPHSKKDVVEFFQRRGIELLRQSPYSPDLNLCDRWLFSLLKKTLRPQLFNSYTEVEEAVRSAMRAIEEEEFKRQVDLLLVHCERVISAGGDYVVPS
jgi:histone-lysine N-methyltransferase SETMAR